MFSEKPSRHRDNIWTAFCCKHRAQLVTFVQVKAKGNWINDETDHERNVLHLISREKASSDRFGRRSSLFHPHKNPCIKSMSR